MTCTICARCESKEDAVCGIALDSSCEHLKCSDDRQVFRNRLQQAKQAAKAPNPEIHFGLIASGDLVMKSGYHRDEIAAKEKIIAFEMEGAGVWDSFPTVVIKGVCDYADSHKNKKWQRYAAATAAACMKAFLKEWRVADTPSQAASQVRERNSDLHCLRQLLVRDPRIERIRISDSKDDLLKGSCAWVLDDPAFTDWWNKDDTRILWIHGAPGKGKTMMAMALIEEISRRLRTSVAEKGVLTYFFCQGTIDGLNDAISVVRGLLYMLVDERRDLIAQVASIYDNEGSRLFEGSYGLYALWKLLLDIVRDPLLPRVYLVIDALDECGALQAELLRLLARDNGTSCSKMKWLITSRNERQIQEGLDENDLVLHTSLELNSRHVSDAVRAFINFKMQKIQKMKNYNDELRGAVEAYLHSNANGTFLWVALVCQRFEKTSGRMTLSVLEEFPPGLEPLYERMLRRIWQMEDRGNVEDCRRILRAATLAHRPLQVNEFVFAAKLPDSFSGYLADIRELVIRCGSFLTVRDDVVYFVHQSAKDYLSGAAGSEIFPCGPLYYHKELARRSLELISSTLTTDVCGLKHPGTLREEVDAACVSRCIEMHVQYACCYWIYHLLGRPSSSSPPIDLAPLDQLDRKAVDHFFYQDLLHWLEALCLIGKISDGILAMVDLESHFMVCIRVLTTWGASSQLIFTLYRRSKTLSCRRSYTMLGDSCLVIDLFSRRHHFRFTARRWFLAQPSALYGRCMRDNRRDG
jgi:NACHT domain